MNMLETGKGRARLCLSWQRLGNDLHVHIAGGRHHIGAAALVGRHPSGEVYKRSLALPPHKEEQLALKAAHALHGATGVTVCVTAGIHLDGITPAEIAALLENAEKAVAQLVRTLQDS